MESDRPSTFKDSKGREWSLSFNIGIVRDIKDTIGVDFGDMQGGALIMLANDHRKFAMLLWMLCEKQCDANKVDEKDFAEALDADAIEAAERSLEGAIISFTRAPMREAVREAMDTAAKAQEAQAQVIRDWMETDDLQTKVREQVKAELGNFGSQSQS